MPKKTTRTTTSTEASSPAAPRRRTTTTASRTAAAPASARLKKAVAHDRARSATPVDAPADLTPEVTAAPAMPRARAKKPATTTRRLVAVAGSARETAGALETSPVPAPAETVEPTHDEIATRAYFIYLRRGTPGNPDHDWQQAVWELRQERGF